MKNKDFRRSKLLKKCKAAKRKGKKELRLKILNHNDVIFLKQHYGVSSNGNSWYIVRL